MTLGPQDPRLEQDVMPPAQEQEVIEILLHQHQRIRELLADIKSGGSRKQQAFEDLRDLLASHEEAEEAVVRPVTRWVVGDSIADARNEEEEHADGMLAALGKLDISSAEFDTMFADFQNAVAAHADHEEADEFPRIKAGLDHDHLVRLGQDLIAAE
ncbi:MAG TPA: hemerythrin domain-containing protein [Streptosporangiaceae bacterium]|nr:hemerythrin domain-containing protein [Streptosporangiaceae bacterium]